MIRLSLLTSLVLILLFAAALAGLHLHLPDTTAQDYFGDCTLPCWQGVQPGVTLPSVAIARLNRLAGFPPTLTGCANPFLPFCDLYTWTVFGGPFVALFVERGEIASVVGFAPDFTLGDALLMLREAHVPFESVEGHPTFSNRPTAQYYPVQIFFDHAQIVVSANTPCPSEFHDLMDTPVSSVEVRSPDTAVFDDQITTLAAAHGAFSRICTAGLP